MNLLINWHFLFILYQVDLYCYYIVFYHFITYEIKYGGLKKIAHNYILIINFRIE